MINVNHRAQKPQAGLLGQPEGYMEVNKNWVRGPGGWLQRLTQTALEFLKPRTGPLWPSWQNMRSTFLELNLKARASSKKKKDRASLVYLV